MSILRKSLLSVLIAGLAFAAPQAMVRASAGIDTGGGRAPRARNGGRATGAAAAKRAAKRRRNIAKRRGIR